MTEHSPNVRELTNWQYIHLMLENSPIGNTFTKC